MRRAARTALLLFLAGTGVPAYAQEDEDAGPPPPAEIRSVPVPPRVTNVVSLLLIGRFANNEPLPVLGLEYEHVFAHQFGFYAAFEIAGQHDYNWMPDGAWGGEVGVRWYWAGVGPKGFFAGVDASKLFFHRAEDDFFTVDAQLGVRWLFPHGFQLQLLGGLGAATPLGGTPVFDFAAQAGFGYAF